jgi:hypothetical protein
MSLKIARQGPGPRTWGPRAKQVDRQKLKNDEAQQIEQHLIVMDLKPS